MIVSALRERMALRHAMNRIACLTAGIFITSCTRPASPAPDAMRIGWCDTTTMKPIGRLAQIPNASSVQAFGTLTGWVIQRETGDALEAAGVRLVATPGGSGQSKRERGTDIRGGFTFDSIEPGPYQIRVRHLNEYQDSASIHVAPGRLDTVRFALRAYRCYGY